MRRRDAQAGREMRVKIEETKVQAVCFLCYGNHITGHSLVFAARVQQPRYQRQPHPLSAPPFWTTPRPLKKPVSIRIICGIQSPLLFLGYVEIDQRKQVSEQIGCRGGQRKGWYSHDPRQARDQSVPVRKTDRPYHHQALGAGRE